MTWKWSTLSQLVAQLYQNFLEKQNTMVRWHNQSCRGVLEIRCSNRYTQSLPQWECRFRRCLVNEKSPQKAIRWYIGVLLYQCLLSYEVFWKKQAATLPVQDNRFNSPMQFESANLHQTRQLNISSEQALHSLEKLPYSKDCFCCQHGFEKPQKMGNTTTFKCAACKVPICKPTKGPCWDLHIIKGLAKKWYQKKK